MVSISPLKFFLKQLVIMSFAIGLLACGGGDSDPPPASPAPIPSPTPVTDTTAPTSPVLVNVSSSDQTTADISWQIATDDQTPVEQISYQIHLSSTPNFAPTVATRLVQLQQASSYVFSRLTPNTTYFTKLVALDNSGNSAISNELTFTTAKFVPQRTSAPVQVLADNANVQISANQLVLNTAELAEPVQTNQVLVSDTAQGGYLRRVTDVSSSGGQTTVTTEPASLADAFEQVSFSTETVFTTPAPANAAARSFSATGKQLQAKVQKRYTVDNNNNVRVEKRQSWQDTGFTLIEEQTPESQVKLLNKTTGQYARAVRLSKQDPVETKGGNLSVQGAKVVLIKPGARLEYNIRAKVIDHNGKITLKYFKLKSIKHDDIKAEIKNYGATVFSFPEKSGDRMLENKLRLYWSPKVKHVSDKPYIATFEAKEDRDSGLDDKIKFKVYIYVTYGSTKVAPKENIGFNSVSADGNLTLTSKTEVSFEPGIKASGNLGFTGLKTAEVIASGKLTLNQNINLKALASATLESTTPNLIEKKFIKVVMAGKVPVYISGRFTIHAEVTATSLAALEVNHDLYASYDIEVGVSYVDGEWIPHKESIPIYQYKLTGDANGEVFGEVRLVPTLEVKIYEAAYGNLIVEPYLKATVAVEGHFKYTSDYTPTTDFNADWDADYRFTKLNMQGGVDVKIRMGLNIFGKDLIGYEKPFSPIKNRSIYALPSLSQIIQTVPADAKDSRTIQLSINITDVEHPLALIYRSLGKTPPESLNPFQHDSLHWRTAQSTGATFSYPGSDKTKVYMTYTQPANYEVRVSGHGESRFIRQYKTTTIPLQDHNGNSIPDFWETSYSLSSNNTDPDNDNATNLQEFENGTFPNKDDSDSDGMKDGWEIANNTNALKNDANADLDRDGYSNLQEYQAGTNPWLASSNPGVQLPETDITPPVITLNGSNPVNIPQHSIYMDAGATAIDAVDGSVRVKIIANNVNTAVVGRYTVTYEASDVANNPVRKTRTVNVTGQQVTTLSKLNDTGITFGGNYSSGNNPTCIGETISQQDCSHGRDAQANAGTLSKIGGGHAGFDFTKLDANGNLPVSANSWRCVKDNSTGLVWEVKAPAGNGGIHDASKTYRWGGKTAQLSGAFGESFNDWNVLVDGSNNNSLCGFNDWRVPAREELRTIVNYNGQGSTFDDSYFPNTLSNWYWSSLPSAGNRREAWLVNFIHGVADRSSYFPIRLVRGEQ